MGICTPYSYSDYGNVIVCTSGTRPTGTDVYPGRVIYETDTTRMWVWSGAAWVFLAAATTAGRPGVILTDSLQAIATATDTQITWGTEVSDVDGWTSGGSGTLTVPTGWDGRYLISFSVSWSAGSGTQSSIAIRKNGQNIAEGVSAGGAYFYPSVSVLHSLSAADTITCNVYQNSGASRDATSRLEIAWLGR